MPMPEDRLETIEHTLNKAYGEITRELAIVKEFTQEAVKRSTSQKILLDEHAQILRDHTTRLDRIESTLAQILTHLKEMPSVSPMGHEYAQAESAQAEPVRPKRDRTFWERALSIFPEET